MEAVSVVDPFGLRRLWEDSRDICRVTEGAYTEHLQDKLCSVSLHMQVVSGRDVFLFFYALV